MNIQDWFPLGLTGFISVDPFIEIRKFSSIPSLVRIFIMNINDFF